MVKIPWNKVCSNAIDVIAINIFATLNQLRPSTIMNPKPVSDPIISATTKAEKQSDILVFIPAIINGAAVFTITW